jgi:hypothetical protein
MAARYGSVRWIGRGLFGDLVGLVECGEGVEPGGVVV